jgi:RNAse (barnase) inhibitor barstar
MIKTRQVLTIAHATSSNALHEILAASLNFPGYYGKNWDAFRDCISDSQQSTLPNELIIKGWEILRKNLPEDAAILKNTLEEISGKKDGAFRVLWVPAED